MGDKVIYVRAEDEALWQWFADHARARRMPVSGLVMNLVQEFRERVESERSTDGA